jgi:hypothetical protein
MSFFYCALAHGASLRLILMLRCILPTMTYSMRCWTRGFSLARFSLVVASFCAGGGHIGIPLKLLFMNPPVCNIPGFETRNREGTDMCIAFMHRKSREFLRFQL